MSFPFNYGMSIYMPPGPDMDRVDRAWGSLGSLLESRQNDKDTNSVAQMAAERMRSLGPQGEQWAKMIQSNPRAALASMEQYGGPMEIENQIIGARAQGEASAAIGQMQQSGASPQEIVGFILRTQGPKAAQAAAEALKVEEAAAGPASYTTAEGVFIRDPSAPGGYRNAGPPKQSGMELSYDSEGRPVFRMGSGLTNSSNAKIEGKQIDMQDNLARLDEIEAGFDPEYLQWGSKARMTALSLKSAAGQPLTQEEEAQLSDWAGFRSVAFENMSYILNQLSGAAISPAEAERLKKSLPDPGTGVFDGDDPVTFRRKMVDANRRIRESIERYNAEKSGQLGVVPPRPQTTAKTAQPSVNPLPPREQLVEGEVYETRHGPARWDGSTFHKVN
jgi:hypothetical protein